MLSWDAESLGGCKGMMIGLEEAIVGLEELKVDLEELMVDLEEPFCSSLHAAMPSTG